MQYSLFYIEVGTISTNYSSLQNTDPRESHGASPLEGHFGAGEEGGDWQQME